MKRSIALAMAVAFSAALRADTLLVVDDVEGAVGPWRRTRVVADPVRSGTRALRWDVHASPILDSPRFLSDWSRFDELRFWAHSEKASGFKIPIVFVSEGGYYIIDWRVDWEGWKQHTIKLSDARPAHKPAGWHLIHSFGFRPQGYGQDAVPEGMALVFDDFALHSAEDLPHTNLLEWVAMERREQIRKLKARGNPYFHSALDSVKSLKPEPSLPEEITSAWTFRGLADRAFTAAWAAGSDDSSRHGDDTLVAHAAAIIDYCLERQQDGSWFYSRKWESGDPNCDRFALGPIMDAIWFLRRLPDMQERWQRWEGPLRELVEFQYVHWGRYKEHGFTDNIAWGASAGQYPNQDVFHLYEMALAHHFWGDEKYKRSADETLQALWDHLLPDGGLNYIGPETEIPVYHDVNVQWIARYYKLTGDEGARDLLARTVDYYPLVSSNEGRPEYYSDCWWKHYWSDGQACGPEIVAGITGDGRNKWLANRLLERRGTGSSCACIYAGMFYSDQVQEQPLADNWLRIDGNIGGPRGRFGTWHFAGTTGGGARDTFVGAMVCRPGRPEPLSGAFMAANVEVGMGEGRRDRTNLYISGLDDVADALVVGDASALAVRYCPRKPYINSDPDRDMPPTPWKATQVWLLTKAGLIGLVELEATGEQTVAYLGGELRFGPSLALGETDGEYACGDIRMRLMENRFASVGHGPARPGYAQSTCSASAVVLRTAGETHTARPGEPVSFIAAVWPDSQAPEMSCERLGADGLWGFRAQFGQAVYTVAFNPGDAAVTLALPGRSVTVPAQKVLLLDAAGQALEGAR